MRRDTWVRLASVCGLIALSIGCDVTVSTGDDSTYARFQDPDSDFSTTNVRDVDEEIVRFDTTTQGIVWAADDRVFDEGQWTVDGVFLGQGGSFQVRFGTKDGQRRAYFTETATATICDFVVTDSFQIFQTNTPVPQE